LANTADDKIERATLLQIANQWRRLANYRVKRERQKTLSKGRIVGHCHWKRQVPCGDDCAAQRAGTAKTWGRSETQKFAGRSDLHPNFGEIYRARFERLAAALDDPQTAYW